MDGMLDIFLLGGKPLVDLGYHIAANFWGNLASTRRFQPGEVLADFILVELAHSQALVLQRAATTAPGLARRTIVRLAG